MLYGASHRKATIHIYSLKKFQEIQKFITFTTTCPKTQEVVLALLVLQGLKFLLVIVAIISCGICELGCFAWAPLL
jgi:hypothetical protein